eukprot:TRINITY_DN667_c0_g1_i2.p3 TRINITY_DN667_c0_g1~~TRINITY_DN667_c0_g1_i2.p3  ORF type:complete len:627 (-),score=58.98 TRINITY_DN667_c0_g1_i2:6471-8351(-)
METDVPRQGDAGDRAGGVQNPMAGRSPPYDKDTGGLSTATGQGSLQGTRPRSAFTQGQGCGDPSRSTGPRVLCQAVFSTEETQRLAPGTGFVPLEQIHPDQTVQDGVPPVHQNGYATGRLGNLGRPPGCIFSREHPPRLQEVPALRLGRGGLPVQRPTVRPILSPSGILKSGRFLCVPPTSPGNQAAHVPGRLAQPRSVSTTVPVVHQGPGSPGQHYGVSSPPREIGVGPQPTVFIPGHAVRHSEIHGLPNSPKTTGSGTITTQDHGSTISVLKNPSQGARLHGIHVGSSSSGEGIQATSPESNGQAIPSLRRLGSTHSYGPLVPPGSPTVVGHTVAQPGGPHQTQQTQGLCQYGRLPVRMGCSLHPRRSLGHLVDPGDFLPHQLAGAASDLPRPTALPGPHQGKWLVLCADNSTCLAYIRHQGGTTSISLSMLAEEILLWSHARDMILDVEFIPGKLNVLADQLSRKDQILPTEWTIATASLQPVWKIWGKPHIDLFATKYSSRLPLYVSPMRDPEAVARNAFSIPWQGRVAYAYPPTSLIPRVLEKYRGDRPRLILVTPDWHSQAWYPELLNLTHAPPRPLNLTRRTLVQPRSGIGHHDPTLLNLTAWLLCEQACEHRVTGPHA